MRLYLIRHGETTGNVAGELDTALPGRPLTDAGVAQAAALPPALDGEPIDIVVASGAARTLATAAPLARARGLDVVVDEGFKEIDAGDNELSTTRQAWDEYVRVVGSWWAGKVGEANPGGETGGQFLSRWDEAVARLSDAGAANAAVVTHGGASRTWTFIRCLNVSVELASIPLPNTGVIVVEGEPGAWVARSWAGTPLDSTPVERVDPGLDFAATQK